MDERIGQRDMDNELPFILVRKFGKDKERYRPYPEEKGAAFQPKAFGENQEKYIFKSFMALTMSWIASCIPSAPEPMLDASFFSILL